MRIKEKKHKTDRKRTVYRKKENDRRSVSKQ